LTFTYEVLLVDGVKRLSDNQIMYRAYLSTPVWKTKRLEALNHYGCKCMRCGEWGNDVHHKTYERVGGDELMEDFEIMCRECHEAHHRAERYGGKRKSKERRGIHRRAIFSALSRKHIKILFEEFPNIGRPFAAIAYGDAAIADRAAKLLGFDYAYGDATRKKKPDPRWPVRPPSSFRRNNEHFNKLQPSGYQGFVIDENPNKWKKLDSIKALCLV
jgi:hypothetical protein